MHHPPELPYNGWTIVMSNPSRFDLQNKQLLTGSGGLYFCNSCLQPETNRYMCDIRTLDEMEKKPLLPNTYALLLLGDVAQTKVSGSTFSLGEQRGSPIFPKEVGKNPIMISSYLPQDAVDRVDLEGEFNSLLNTASNEDDSDEDGNEKSRHGKTSRKNWSFWLQQDVKKALILCKNKGKIPPTYDSTETTYKLFPRETDVLEALSLHKGRHLYFDIETDASQHITCFAFSWDLHTVWVVPLLRFDYSVAYSNAGKILLALAKAMRDNTTVTHNGGTFDFIVLARNYRIPFGRNLYDTMVAQNRIYPEAEKSLGHCISLPWMWEPYHKAEGCYNPHNRFQEEQLWLYCGKDVSTLVRLHKAQTTFISKNPGLKESVEDAMSFMYPYMMMTMQGIIYDQGQVEHIISTNDRYMTQYVRWLNILIGEKNLTVIRGSGKSDLPSSSKQCSTYFYTMLGYPVQARSKETNNPKFDAKAAFKLKLALAAHDIYNPVVDIVLACRRLGKQTGSLGFIPWRIIEER